MDTAPSEQELIDGLKSFVETVEGIPTVRGMSEEGPYSPYYYKDRFGSWHNALKAAGIEPGHGVVPDYTREGLLENLKRVEKTAERPPRRRDLEEHGEYPYDLYDHEFDSYIHALEEAGIEPEEKQYRFSSVDTPPEKRGSKNIEILRNNGPTPASGLHDGRSTKDRQRGMWKFTVGSGSTKPSDPVYYLDGEHAPELVIRRFFEHNPHVLEYRSPHGIRLDIGNHKRSWVDVGREVVNELIEKGIGSISALSNLVVVRPHLREDFVYCFENSVSSIVEPTTFPEDEYELEEARPVWGFSEEYIEIWDQLSEGDVLLFSPRPGLLTHYFEVDKKFKSYDLMKNLWIRYDNGVRVEGIETPWPNIVVGKEVIESKVTEKELFSQFEADVDDSAIQHIRDEHLKPFLNSYNGIRSYVRENSRSSVGLEAALEQEQEISPDDLANHLLELQLREVLEYGLSSEYQQLPQQVRKEAFREGIYKIYDGCAICGSKVESPSGGHNLEAAHILPKAHDGPDVVQNGLALCPQHHWAFDEGWFHITTEYEIIVSGDSELQGYERMNKYNGDSLNLPSSERHQPYQEFLSKRNEIF